MTKLKIIDDTDIWMEMRDLRNRMSHYYLPEKLKGFYDVIQNIYSKTLITTLQRLENYIVEKK